jgi:hypothetical protein
MYFKDTSDKEDYLSREFQEKNYHDFDLNEYIQIEEGPFKAIMTEFSNNILKPIQSNLSMHSEKNLWKQFMVLVCQSESKWKETIMTLSKMPKVICSKPIKNNENCFVCYDCGMDSQYLVLCSSCFYNGDHQGHRVK